MLRRTLLVVALWVAACGSTEAQKRAPVDPVDRSIPGPIADDLPEGSSIVRTSRKTGFKDLLEDLTVADVVYIGESHEDADHHLVQLRIIEHLHSKGRLHGIGMEMFRRPHQDALDAYVEGRIDEQAMLEQTGWKKNWGYDFELYKPILDFAREWRLPVVALNIDMDVRKRISDGGLEALSNSERAWLPAIDTSDEAHRNSLKRIFEAHLEEGEAFDQAKFDRFFLMQCVWDQVMADSLVQWFRKAPKNAQIAVLAGTGHMRNRRGIPATVRKRIGKREKIVIPISVREFPPPRSVFAESYADWVWLTGVTNSKHEGTKNTE
ncbi:MAG: ChaN family lipoprotein [Planctomycetota bacterium]|jgi:uncharacterized iron-regulated protein